MVLSLPGLEELGKRDYKYSLKLLSDRGSGSKLRISLRKLCK